MLLDVEQCDPSLLDQYRPRIERQLKILEAVGTKTRAVFDINEVGLTETLLGLQGALLNLTRGK